MGVNDNEMRMTLNIEASSIPEIRVLKFCDNNYYL